MSEFLTAKMHEVHRAFLDQIDRELAAAYLAGDRLAVSEFEFEPVPTRYGQPATSARVLFLRLGPDESPPSGRKWTIYETDKPPRPALP